MIKDLLDLFKELSSERSKQRDKTIVLLEQVSAELAALSSFWSKIATITDAEELSHADLREKLREQRSHYEGILLFRSELFHTNKNLPESGKRLAQILDSAIDEKSGLYGLIQQLSGNSSGLAEAKVLVEGTPGVPADGKIAFIKKQREAAGLSGAMKTVSKEQKDSIVSEIQKRTEDLSGLSGQFRAAIAVFKSETPFV